MDDRDGIKRFGGFDYGRALLCLAVVAWHDSLLGGYTMPGDVALQGYVPGLKDLLYHNVLLMAVPAFMLISLFLYGRNRTQGQGYFARRAWRLATLLLFWMAVLYLYRAAEEHFAPGRGLARDFAGPLRVLSTLVFGGHSHLYFLSSLLLVTVALECFNQAVERRLNSRAVEANLVMLAISCGMLLAVPLMLGGGRLGFYATQDYNPYNFLPYVFMANLLALARKAGRLRALLAACLALYAATAAAEWALLGWLRGHMWQDAMLLVPSYTRLSSVLGGTLVAGALLSLGNTGVPLWVRRLSGASLGIYCMQSFVPLYDCVGYLAPRFAEAGSYGRPLLFVAKVLLLYLLTSMMKRVGALKRFT